MGGGAGEEAPGEGSRAERGQDIEKEADQSFDLLSGHNLLYSLL